MDMIIPLILIIGIFYFMLIRPERKRKKEAEDMRAAMKVGDVITTIGGITGTVVSIKDEKLVIETSADRVRIEFYKWALSSNDTATAEAKAAREKAQAEKAKAKAVEYEPIKSAIFEFVKANGTKTTAEIAKGVEVLEGSSPKASAMCRQMVDEGRLTASEVSVKGKGKQKAYTANIESAE